MTSFFHAYDLRGKYPQEISEKEAKKVGKAYGTYTDAEEVLIGKDGRTHGDKITKNFIQGIKSTGTDVINAGTTPTPTIYFGMTHNNIESAAIVTASHNPPEYTGFKFTKRNALAMSREGGMKQIQEIYEKEDFDKGEGTEKQIELEEEYIEFLTQKIELEKNLKIVINTGNGVAGKITRRLFEKLDCNYKIINERIDGNFPNHLPAPGEKEAQKQLKDAMDKQTDIGVIFDGDADRAGFITSENGYIEEDKVLSLFAEETLKHKNQGTVLYDLRASKLVPEIINKNKGNAKETRVGHTFISEEIHQNEDIVFAGELSGHYYFPAYNIPWDDGFFAALLMAQAFSQGKDDRLKEYTNYPVSPEARIPCPHNIKQKIIDEIEKEFSDKKTSDLDGVKIHFEEGWALVRPSNTEAKMSVRCEADTQGDLEEIQITVEEKVKELINKHST